MVFQLVAAQTPTVGVTKYKDDNSEGYLLFSPMNSKKTYLMDKCGKVVHQWTSTYFPGLSVSLFPDGSLLRCGTILNPLFGPGAGGVLEKYDWNGNLTWHIQITDSLQCLHHDAKILPNGNILAIIWVKKSPSELVAKGRNISQANFPIWSERIVEFEPIGTDSFDIVWEWNAWDHLVQNFDNGKPGFGQPDQHPELFDINYFETPKNGQDWFHMNSIDYNAARDEIVLTSHSLCEFYVIDHSTNLFQAAGHSGGNRGKGGDVLYRWGNSQTYGRGADTSKKLFLPHHAHWIKNGFDDAGNIMVFNNGNGRPGGNFSTVEVIKPPIDVNGNYTIASGKPFAPAQQKIAYLAPKPSDFYAMNVSGAFSQEDGHILISSGPNGRIFEIDNNDSIVWEYRNPVSVSGIFQQGQNPVNNPLFRAEFYTKDFAGFNGKTLTPASEIEGNPTNPPLCESQHTNKIVSPELPDMVYPIPASDKLFLPSTLSGNSDIFELSGKHLLHFEGTNVLHIGTLHSGTYILTVASDAKIYRFVIQKL